MSSAAMNWTMHEHVDADALAANCAARLGQALDDAVHGRGTALLALAGGRTSTPVFRRLASRSCDWSRVAILPSDERWVAADHADCNLRQMRDAFATAAGIRWLALVPAQPSAGVDASFANAMLAAHAQPFDACMLGMGADGHVASLFPGAPNLSDALDPANGNAAVAIIPDPMPDAGPHPRISLTLSRILRSRRLLLVISGDDKRRVLERARSGDATLPVAALVAATHPAAEIHWSP